MARKAPDPRGELIHCNICNEDYSPTYKRCPVCGGKPPKTQTTAPKEQQPMQNKDDYVFDGGFVFDELDAEQSGKETPSRTGKRLHNTNSSQPSETSLSNLIERFNLTPMRIAGFVFTLVVIISALLIVTRLILPMIELGSTQIPDDSNPSQSQPLESTDPIGNDPIDGDHNTVEVPPVETDPVETTPVDSDPDTSDPVETIPIDQTATGLTLDKTEFTISDRYPNPVVVTATLLPAGSTGTISWSSSDETVVIVDQSGTVTAVGKGQATITASLPGGISKTCLVRSTVTSSSNSPSNSTLNNSAGSSTNNASSSISLSREDFTMNDTWPSYTFEVTGASGDLIWHTSDASVATVDGSGTVTKVGTGHCTITVTDAAGNSASCVVRCK